MTCAAGSLHTLQSPELLEHALVSTLQRMQEKLDKGEDGKSFQGYFSRALLARSPKRELGAGPPRRSRRLVLSEERQGQPQPCLTAFRGTFVIMNSLLAKVPKIKSRPALDLEWKSQASALCQHALPEADVCPLQKNSDDEEQSACHRALCARLGRYPPEVAGLPPAFRQNEGADGAREKRSCHLAECSRSARHLQHTAERH